MARRTGTKDRRKVKAKLGGKAARRSPRETSLPTKSNASRRRRLVRKVSRLSDLGLIRVARQLFLRHTAVAEALVNTVVSTVNEANQRMYPVRVRESREDLERGIRNLLEGETWENGVYRPDASWRTIVNFGVPGKGATDLEAIRCEARLMHLLNPLYRGIIETYVAYTVGQDVEVNITHDNKQLQKRAMDYFTRWKKREGSDFEDRLQEAARRLKRDGEVIIWERIKQGREADAVSDGLKTGAAALLRFLEPERMKEPLKHALDRAIELSKLTQEQVASRSFTHGVETEGDDPETVRAYWFCDTEDHKEVWTRIPEDEIRHIKGNCERNSKRGCPALLSVTNTIREYDKWITSRVILNQIRSAIAMVIYREEAVPGDMEAAIAEESDGEDETVDNEGNEVTIPKKLLDMGSTVNLPTGMKMEFLTPNVQAQDAEADGKAILRLIAVCLGLADYMVTGDASASSYSSQQVAEARTTITLMGEQQSFHRHSALIVKDIIEIESGGKITDADFEDMSIEVKGPNIVVRNPAEFSKALDTYIANGTMSKKTARARLGLNNDEEEMNIQAERTEDESLGAPSGIPESRPKRRGQGEGDAAKKNSKGGAAA